MVDDFDWFWSSEYGRDKMLRDEVEGLQSVAAAASARSSRLSSQITRLQGSLEKRLTALSVAFDAYVELGDVREQLAAFPDTSVVRRKCAAAIEALASGRPAEQVDAQGLGYWLPYAMNAVSSTATGGRDAAAEAKARELSRDAELFMIAAAGALGHGDQVSGRVADLLIVDGALNSRQVVLWQAVRDGVYGPSALNDIGPLWRDALVEAGEEDWASWVLETGQRATPTEGLRWLEEQATLADQATLLADLPGSDDVPAEADALDVRAALRSVVSDLVGEGMDNERELLERARVLRARVESPTRQPSSATNGDGPVEMSTLEAVRSAYIETKDPVVRATVLEWMRPSLQQVIARFARETAEDDEPVTTSVRTPGGQVQVSTDGVPPAERARLVNNIREITHYRPVGLIVAAVSAAVAVVLALVVGLGTPQTVLAVMLGIVGVICAGFVVKALMDRRRAQHHRQADLERLDRLVREGQEQAKDQARKRSRAAVEAQGLAVRLQQRYATPVASGATTVQP